MIGPVLYLEVLLGARRTKLYAFRWVFAGWMLVTLLWLSFVAWLTSGLFIFQRNRFFTENVCATFSIALVVQQWSENRRLKSDLRDAEQQIVERNQHDPVRQTDNADEQEPHKHAANNVADQCHVVLLGLRLAQCARYQRGDDRGQCG